MYFTSSIEDSFFEWQMKQVPGFDRTRVDSEDEKSESNIRNPTTEKNHPTLCTEQPVRI